MKTQDHYWTDPPADELVQRHRISSGASTGGVATSPANRRPGLQVSPKRGWSKKAFVPLLTLLSSACLVVSPTWIIFLKINYFVTPSIGNCSWVEVAVKAMQRRFQPQLSVPAASLLVPQPRIMWSLSTRTTRLHSCTERTTSSSYRWGTIPPAEYFVAERTAQ